MADENSERKDKKMNNELAEILAWLFLATGWVAFVVLVAIWALTFRAHRDVARLQNERHQMDELCKQALGRQVAMLAQVNQAMAQELHRRGFTPPAMEDDADWWKRGDDSGRPPGR